MWNFQWSYEYYVQHKTCAMCGGNYYWEGCQAGQNSFSTSLEQPSCEQQYDPYPNATDSYDANWGNYEQPSWKYEDAWEPQECRPQERDTSLEELLLSYIKNYQEEMKMMQS